MSGYDRYYHYFTIFKELKSEGSFYIVQHSVNTGFPVCVFLGKFYSQHCLSKTEILAKNFRLINRYINQEERILADNKIIAEWFRQYNNDILNFLIYYTGRIDVEDMVQEVFIRALRKMNTFQELSNPKTWLFSIARNIAIDEMRKQKKEKDKQQQLLHFQGQSYSNSPEDIYRLNETNKEIYQTIQTLKQNYCDVLILKGIKELSVKETAEILDWSENKVKVTYNRALKALAKKIGGLVDE